VTFRLRQGSVHPKAISLITLAAAVLTPLSNAYASFGDGTPTIPNPSVFGQTIDQNHVDGASGAFTQKIALDIPPGRNGLQPDLSLQYNSQNTSDGIVGYGWSLDIPYIQRLNKTGSQDLYATSSYFTSSIDGEIITATSSGSAPSIQDTVPLTVHTVSSVTSTSLTYTVPAGGSNQIEVVELGTQNATVSATQNGSAMTCAKALNGNDWGSYWYCWLAAPTSGTLQINWTPANSADFVVFTLNNASQTGQPDLVATTTSASCGSTCTLSTSVTPKTNNTFFTTWASYCTSCNSITHGSGQTEYLNTSTANAEDTGSYEVSTTTSTKSVSETASGGTNSADLNAYVWGGAAIATAATYKYMAKVDDGSYNAYSYSGNTWVMYDKKGTKYTFGSDDSGRMYDTNTGTSTQTYRWYLEEIRDTNDNYIKYTYLRDGNEVYPYTIVYTGHGSTDGIATVTFATSTRPDARVSYAPGFVASTTQRISEIDASVNNSVVRKYLLGYGTGNNGYRSLLTSIHEQGIDDNGTITSLPATRFSYASSSTQFFSPMSGGPSPWNQAYVAADINGNGINDVTAFYYDTNSLSNKSYIYPDNGSLNTSYVPPDYWADLPPLTPRERGVRLIDVNGDGKPDIVRGYHNYTTGTDTVARYINGSSGTSFSFTSSSTYSGVIPAFDVDGSGPVHNDSTGIFGE
jgi:hypothetical protein